MAITQQRVMQCFSAALPTYEQNAIAQKIIDGNVPNILSGKRILRIDMPLVVSGSRFKGELEDRIRNILGEVKKNSNVILFIDNFHTIAILSGQESSAEAGNIIKNVKNGEKYV